MNVNKVSTLVPKEINNNKKQSVISTPSFGGIPAGVDKFALGLADTIENGGLAVSFLVQDMLGTNLPRPIAGLTRNLKDNNGEANKNFAVKELAREMTTGPSMFIIPGISFGISKKIFGKSINIPVKIIKSLGNIHAANPLNEAGKAISKKDFYRNTFTEIIKNAKSETQPGQETLQTAADFAERLAKSLESQNQNKNIVESIKGGVQKLLHGNQNETINKLSDEFIEISKKHARDAVHTDFTQASVSSSVSAPFKKTVEYIISYADDAIVKAGSQNSKNAKEFAAKLSNKKAAGRFASNILIYAAVLGFLQLIPKFYNKVEGEGNSGLKGLMKQETFNDKSLNTSPDKKKETGEKSKTNVSFGSSAGFIDKISGNGIMGKLASGIEFEGCNVSFPMLLGIMGFGILLPRVRESKDKYDKEEIIRRDVTTCATMCFAEKALRKVFSKFNEKSSGFVLAAKEKGFKNESLPKRLFDYVRPIKGVNVLSSEQIVSRYSGLDKYKDGIKGFCEFIDGQGGNLSKIFSFTDESKNIVQSLLSKEGKDIASADNSVITAALSNNAGSEEVKNLIDLFKNKDNQWVKKAKTLNARFTALSVVVLVPVFLGFLLPKINEKATKKRIREEQKNNEIEQNTRNNFNTNYLNNKTNKIFDDITQYVR